MLFNVRFTFHSFYLSLFPLPFSPFTIHRVFISDFPLDSCLLYFVLYLFIDINFTFSQFLFFVFIRFCVPCTHDYSGFLNFQFHWTPSGCCVACSVLTANHIYTHKYIKWIYLYYFVLLHNIYYKYCKYLSLNIMNGEHRMKNVRNSIETYQLILLKVESWTWTQREKNIVENG